MIIERDTIETLYFILFIIVVLLYFMYEMGNCKRGSYSNKQHAQERKSVENSKVFYGFAKKPKMGGDEC